MDSAFGGSKTDAEAVDRKIIGAKNRHMNQKTSAAEAQAGAPEINRLAGGVAYIESEKPLSKSCMPRGTFGNCKVQPAFGCKKTKTEEKKGRSELGQIIVQRRSRPVIEERIRDSHPGSQERDKHGKRDYEKNQINDSGDQANPKSCAGQGEGSRIVSARIGHFYRQDTSSCF